MNQMMPADRTGRIEIVRPTRRCKVAKIALRMSCWERGAGIERIKLILDLLEGRQDAQSGTAPDSGAVQRTDVRRSCYGTEGIRHGMVELGLKRS